MEFVFNQIVSPINPVSLMTPTGSGGKPECYNYATSFVGGVPCSWGSHPKLTNVALTGLGVALTGLGVALTELGIALTGLEVGEMALGSFKNRMNCVEYFFTPEFSGSASRPIP
jgi:hypothetical protein